MENGIPNSVVIFGLVCVVGGMIFLVIVIVYVWYYGSSSMTKAENMQARYEQVLADQEKQQVQYGELLTRQEKVLGRIERILDNLEGRFRS